MDSEREYVLIQRYAEGRQKIKIEGDVWGLQATEVNVEFSIAEKVEFKNGDTVTFQNSGKLTDA